MTELKTEKGIKFITIALFASLVLSLISTIVYLTDFPSLVSAVLSSSYTSMGVDNFYNVMGIFLVISSLLCLVGLGLLIVKVIGIVTVYMGRSEFGQEHDKKVSTGCIMIIVGFVVGFVPMVGALSGIAFALGMVYLIVSIALEEHRRLLWAGFGFTLGLAIISQGLMFYQMFTFRMIFSLTYVLLIEVGSLIGGTLILLAFYGTYRGIKEGAIAPVTGTGELHVATIPEEKAVPERVHEAAGDERGDIIADLSKTLGISMYHAGILNKAGYQSIDELRSATMKDMISLRGVNPTVARKIVKRMKGIRDDEIVTHFSKTFGITMEAARAVYEAGYRTMQDLEFATVDELILMDGINPTVARKVVRKIETDSGLQAY